MRKSGRTGQKLQSTGETPRYFLAQDQRRYSRCGSKGVPVGALSGMSAGAQVNEIQPDV